MIHANQAQAIYLQYVLQAAQRALAAMPKKALVFDPQARVLMPVVLSEQQFQEIAKQMDPHHDGSNAKQFVEQALRQTVTEKTLVSLDISSLPVCDDYFQQLHHALTQIGVTDPKQQQQYLLAYATAPKDSVIALQQEIDFHLALTLRLYQKFAPKLGVPAEQQRVHQATMQRVNQQVLSALVKGIKESVSNAKLDVGRLNRYLDKSRQEIARQGHKILREEILRYTKVHLSDAYLRQEPRLSHWAQTTTATDSDVLHDSSAQGMLTWIGGSAVTSHDRAPKKLADKRLITLPFSQKNDGTFVVQAVEKEQTRVRVPALDVKTGLSRQAQIEDVSQKLSILSEKYDFARAALSDPPDKPRAFIYHLLTALHDRFGDLGGNQQTQGTTIILQGLHQYNQAQSKAKPPVFCFLQNISVNGFGDTLGYGRNDPLRQEVTLMSELALMHTLYEQRPESCQAILDTYQRYLVQQPRARYFSESNEGREAIQLISRLKAQWQKETSFYETDKIPVATLALKNMMANNAHFEHGFSKLFQALSSHVALCSIGGCKSANERAQCINGRVALLDALAAGRLQHSAKAQEVNQLLHQLALNEPPVRKNMQRLNQVFHELYNEEGLQAGASLISLVDQGASAKIEAYPNVAVLPRALMSRNYAEERARIMTNLSQRDVSSLQSHKKLTNMMLQSEIMAPRQRSGWQLLKESYGVIGAAILSVVSFGVALKLAERREQIRVNQEEIDTLTRWRAPRMPATSVSAVATVRQSSSHTTPLDFHSNLPRQREGVLHLSQRTNLAEPNQLAQQFRVAMQRSRASEKVGSDDKLASQIRPVY